MRKKILLLNFVCIFTLVTACSKTESTLDTKVNQLEKINMEITKKLNDKEIKIEELFQNIKELESKNEVFNVEKESFALISNLSRDFVRAHTSGDKEKLLQLLSKDITLEEKDNKLYAIIKENDSEWLLFNYESESKFDDWVIQGYQYNIETNTFTVFIREFYARLNGETVSPPTFLVLTFKFHENKWKIINLVFDV